MSKIIKIPEFIKANTQYKILTPINASVLLLSGRKTSVSSYSSANLSLRKNYYNSARKYNVTPTYQWCHYWQIVPVNELARFETDYGIKFNSDHVLLPPDICCQTSNKPFSTKGIKFASKKKHKSPLGISSFVIPWSELNKITFEEL